MPFRTPPGARRDLLSLIDAELRQRLEEAVDHACLDAMVSARRANGASLPARDDPRDREEFTATVRAFLVRLRDEIPADASAGERVAPAAGAHVDEEWRLLSLQIACAKSLPDYWQRFEAARRRFVADSLKMGDSGRPGEAGTGLGNPPASGGSRRSVLSRLFGRD
jgi:hypothetical protein